MLISLSKMVPDAGDSSSDTPKSALSAGVFMIWKKMDSTKILGKTIENCDFYEPVMSGDDGRWLLK